MFFFLFPQHRRHCGHRHRCRFYSWTGDSIRRFVRPSVGPLVFEAFLRWGWGVDGGWMPLPTRLQKYCNPVLLVMIIIICGPCQCGRSCSRRRNIRRD